jgi:hypothetical protein
MDEREIVAKLKSELDRLFQETGFFKTVKFFDKPDSPSSTGNKGLFSSPDLEAKVKTSSDEEFRLLFEVKPVGQPRIVRNYAVHGRLSDTRKGNTYLVFAAPYLSEDSINICRESGIGCIDLAGNCYFKFDGVYISRSKYPNPIPNTRPLKEIFSTKSTRILRVLLLNQGKEWYVKDLAKEAGVSLGQTSNVKKILLDYEYIEEVRGEKKNKIKLAKPDKLLTDWSDNYSYTKSMLFGYYSSDNQGEIEAKIANFCNSTDTRYAFTLTSADIRLTKYLRDTKRVYVYIEKPFEPAASALKWKKVDSGENITVLVPYDEGVFYGLQTVGGVKLVSDIQLYLDLKNFKQRGKDAAEFLLERRISDKWLT